MVKGILPRIARKTRRREPAGCASSLRAVEIRANAWQARELIPRDAVSMDL
jgi:hypothetical protein